MRTWRWRRVRAPRRQRGCAIGMSEVSYPLRGEGSFLKRGLRSAYYGGVIYTAAIAGSRAPGLAPALQSGSHGWDAPRQSSAARRIRPRSPPGKGRIADCRRRSSGSALPGPISRRAASIPSADVPDIRPMTFMGSISRRCSRSNGQHGTKGASSSQNGEGDDLTFKQSITPIFQVLERGTGFVE